MDKNKFIKNFTSQFIDADEISIDETTHFRDIGSWDSMTGMAVLVMIQDDYGVDMNDADLKKCITVQDIFDFISDKKNP